MRGMHAIIECYGNQAYLGAGALVDLMTNAAAAAGARILTAKVHEFGEGQGNTGVLLLAESHISVHTWPEHGYAAFDIFMCGNDVQLNKAIESITSYDPASMCHIKILNRGSARQSLAIDAIADDFIERTPLVIEKILKNTQIKSLQHAQQGIVEVLKFLQLCSQSEHTLVPSRQVDAIWHELILFTRSYQDLCASYLSRFIHHTPSDQSQKNQDNSGYELTLMLYQKAFGEPNSDFWPDAQQRYAHCGPCESA